MTTPGNLDALLSDSINPDGKDLFALASLVLSRAPFLRHVIRRQKTIRTDPRVLALGVGIDADAAAVLEKNLNLVAYLLREAIRNGNEDEDTWITLAECLHELGRDGAALAVIAEAEGKSIASPRMARVKAKALLSTDGPQAFATFAKTQGRDAGDLWRVAIVDHRRFDDWANRAGAEMTVIADEPVSVDGHFRFGIDTGLHDFDHTLTAAPLRGAMKRNLQVYAGFLPFANECGYFHEEAVVTLRDSPLTVEVAPTVFAFDADKAHRVEFAGKYLVPCCPHRYFGQYSHGIVQIYSRLIAALETGKFDDHGILLPGTTPDWVFAFLSNAGVDTGRLKKMPVDAISSVEEACVLEMKWDVCPREIQALRRALARMHPHGDERVNYYLTRKNVKNFHRSLVNEDEFIAICEARGFTVIDPMDYSIDEQIALFSKAGTIVTSDSSGDTNMIYAPPGAEVIIIIPGRFCGMLMADVAIACGHTMSVLIGEFLAGDRNVDHSHGPYRADPKLLSDLLDRIG